MPKQIAVFGSFLTNPHSQEYILAEELGYLLACQGLQVLCGGHGGIADPLVAGMTRGGGRIRGVALAASRYPLRKARMNPLITERDPVNSMAGRLERFAGADAFIFFTGGIGTLSEFAFIWHTMQLDTDFDRPLVCLSGGWKRVLAQIRLEQMIKYKYYRMLHLCGRAGDAVAVVSKDYTLKYTAANQRIDKRAVLFDLDGVLVESSEETFLRACENLGRFFRIQEVMAAFRQAGGLPAAGSPRPFYQSVFAQLKIEPCEVAELADAVSTMFAGLPPLYDDVVETLMKLKQQGFATGILSVRPLPQLREILAAHGLSRWIDQLYPLSDRLDGNSGGPTGWVLQAAGWSQGETVYIGDRCHENPPACALDAILLDRHLAHIGQDAVAVIRSLRELPFLLRRPEVATF